MTSAPKQEGTPSTKSSRSVDELCGHSDWLLEHEHLKTCWPYDEIESLVTGVLEDGKIEPAEHALLMEFFGEFVAVLDSKSVASARAREAATVVGLCAVCLEIRFPDSVFCLTGSSRNYSRQDFAAVIAGRGGTAVDGVSKRVHYLVMRRDILLKSGRWGRRADRVSVRHCQ